jgi:hypothetical protein
VMRESLSKWIMMDTLSMTESIGKHPYSIDTTKKLGIIRERKRERR